MVIVTNKNPEDGSKNLLVYEAINGGGIMEAEIELRPHHNTIISNRTLVLQTIEVGLTLLAGMNWNSHALGMKN